MKSRQEKALTRTFFDRLRVRTPHMDAPVWSLSGGNQQKIAMAKWLAAQCKILLIDEPTRGVDVGAKRAIYELIRSLAEEGMAVLLISSEHLEVIGLAHRVLVMREGRVVAEFDEATMSEDAVLRAAFATEGSA